MSEATLKTLQSQPIPDHTSKISFKKQCTLFSEYPLHWKPLLPLNYFNCAKGLLYWYRTELRQSSVKGKTRYRTTTLLLYKRERKRAAHKPSHTCFRLHKHNFSGRVHHLLVIMAVSGEATLVARRQRHAEGPFSWSPFWPFHWELWTQCLNQKPIQLLNCPHTTYPKITICIS